MSVVPEPAAWAENLATALQRRAVSVVFTGWGDRPLSHRELTGVIQEEAAPRTRMYGLTADEWLHLAAEGQDSEVAPCCGDIGQLREWLNGLATAQGKGESWLFWQPVLDSYEVALGSHDALADEKSFPVLHRVLAGVRAEKTAQDEFFAAQHARIREQENPS